MSEITEHEAMMYIRDKLKTATPEVLQKIICGINSPLCSNDCPLRDKSSASCECKKIVEK